MTTPSEYATDAASTLHQILRTSPRGFDAEGAAAVIEQAIRNATHERESNARRQLTEVQSAAQERLARLLSASPAVIYSFKATGDYAPTFVSDNLIAVRENTWKIRISGELVCTPMNSAPSKLNL